ncbi:MAG: hypothetical protein QOE77_1238 [Blastocatellia bacterium]|jgi:hypothetical protein|nr:hypothetical protein [Blastocatellia bacterium]
MQIEETDTADFVSCLREAIRNKPYVKPFNGRKNALVFSFDKDMRPFHNYSKGWHLQKPYFDRTPSVVRQIREVLFTHRTDGGRIFLDNSRVYFVDGSLRRTDLCSIRWPKGRDVVSEIRDFKIRLGPRLTLTRVYFKKRH